MSCLQDFCWRLGQGPAHNFGSVVCKRHLWQAMDGEEDPALFTLGEGHTAGDLLVEPHRGTLPQLICPQHAVCHRRHWSLLADASLLQHLHQAQGNVDMHMALQRKSMVTTARPLQAIGRETASSQCYADRDRSKLEWTRPLLCGRCGMQVTENHRAAPQDMCPSRCRD